jgi:hypothetical protein
MGPEVHAPLVAILDDDLSVQAALQDLVESERLPVACFSSAQDFLESEARSNVSCRRLFSRAKHSQTQSQENGFWSGAQDDRLGVHEGACSDGCPVLGGDAALDESLSSGRQNLVGEVQVFHRSRHRHRSDHSRIEK